MKNTPDAARSSGRGLRFVGWTLLTCFLSYISWQYLTPPVMDFLYPSSQLPIITPLPTEGQAPTHTPDMQFTTPAPTTEPTPVAPRPTAQALAQTRPDAFGVKHEVFQSGKAASGYTRQTPISFQDASTYTDVEGVLTFRGNHYRNGGAYGTIDENPSSLLKMWEKNIGAIDKWTGVGWNGQPAVVRWDEKMRQMMNLYPDKKAKEGLIEVIYATLDGNIYFLDLEDGTPTRDPIVLGFPIKGSVSVDPRGYPLLYTGQGIAKNGERRGDMGYHIYSLIDQKKLFFFSGYDPLALRYWGACDSSPLVDGATDTLIAGMENGLFLTFDLNTVYEPENAYIAVSPVVTTYRYSSPYSKVLGIENSPAVYDHYAYFADNSGLVTCLDLNTMTPVWTRFLTDDTDASIVIEEVDGKVYLYTGCEVDQQGQGGSAYLRKLDAMTGEILWERAIPARYVPDLNGGLMATPVCGRGDLAHLVIYTIAMPNGHGGLMLALDKVTGSIVWEKTMQQYAWSSPTAVYDEQGKGYLVQCDASGVVHLIEGISGQTLATLKLNGNVEGSPAIFDNLFVVGTRSRTIYGIRIGA